MNDERGKSGPVLHDEAEAKAAAGSTAQYIADNLRVQRVMHAMLNGCDGVDHETLTNASLVLFCALLHVDGQTREVAVDLVTSAFDGKASRIWAELMSRAMHAPGQCPSGEGGT